MLSPNRDVHAEVYQAVDRILLKEPTNALALALRDALRDVSAENAETILARLDEAWTSFKTPTNPVADGSNAPSSAEPEGGNGADRVLLSLQQRRLMRTIEECSEPEMRREAVLVLGESRDPRIIPVMIKALTDEDEIVRLRAIDTLRGLGPAASGAVPHLIDALREPSATLRVAVISTLGEIGGQRAVEALIEALEDARPNIRLEAAEALGKMKDLRAAPMLVELLSDEKGDVRRAAARALGELRARGVVPALTHALKDGDSFVRWRVAEALGEFGPEAKAAMPALTERLGDTYDYVRGPAALALGRIGDQSAVPSLIEVLQDRCVSVRRAAAKALGDIGDPRGIVPLREQLRRETDSWVRDEMTQVLGGLER